jgi:hypothetical protein
VTIGAIDPEQRRVAERLVLAALRKFHSEQPLSVDLRVDSLVSRVRTAAGRKPPPRVDGLAARLGIPPAVLDQLRAAGMLRRIAPGIDYPADVWSALQARIGDKRGPMSISRLRDELHTTRRHAEAILSALEGARAPRRR